MMRILFCVSSVSVFVLVVVLMLRRALSVMLPLCALGGPNPVVTVTFWPPVKAAVTRSMPSCAESLVVWKGLLGVMFMMLVLVMMKMLLGLII